jgi:hypothetical protein
MSVHHTARFSIKAYSHAMNNLRHFVKKFHVLNHKNFLYLIFQKVDFLSSKIKKNYQKAQESIWSRQEMNVQYSKTITKRRP